MAQSGTSRSIPSNHPTGPEAAARPSPGLGHPTSKSRKSKSKRSTHQPEQMQPSVAVLSMLHSLDDLRRLVKLPFLDTLVDPDNVLPDDAPRADIKMPVLAQRIYE